MEFTKNDMKITKGVAIIFMLLLHLFCRKEVNGLYETFPVVNGVPMIYYIALFGDACVPMFCFASGYGLYVSIDREKGSILKRSFERILKLLINYWIVLVVFVMIGFLLGNAEIFPGTLTKFLLNFFVLSSSYNGAWWFLQTYIILVLIAPLLFIVIKKYNSILILLVSGFIYLISYIQRINHVLDFGDSTEISMFVNSIVLLGTSQLPFIIGSIFAKEKIYTKINIMFNRIAMKNVICLLGIFLLVIIHAFFESMIIAPITGITFICFFNLIDKSAMFKKVLDFFGNHSTNLWFTHMFFYMTIFPKLTFGPKYPILILAWLIILCLFSSYIINFINKPIIRLMDKKVSVIKYNKNVIG
ncbi:acyltransferase [Bacillus sp. AFS073361]|uniref:acyltransferase family protein n=1 Tax=Bacillus sp. AFS073361 TaxID=2033511 RepID=UPI000BF9B931|nr:acyltransferase family protein [Bacillus sp. AFS073361]PFP29506.1 acyltransferase [Bacillus sp. AFS073361]